MGHPAPGFFAYKNRAYESGTRLRLSDGYGPKDGPPVADARPLRPLARGYSPSDKVVTCCSRALVYSRSATSSISSFLQPSVVAPPVSIPGAQITGSAQSSVPPPAPGRVPPPPLPGNSSDAGRMRLEILRLHSQIKKLEMELVAEREYTKALEQHVTTLSEGE